MDGKKYDICHYIKWALAFICGLIFDVLELAGLCYGTSEIVLSCLMFIALIICFDVYRKEGKNILKLAYITIISTTSAYFSIGCIFLMIFEMITTNQNNL